jgi:hypothetical protein
MIYLGSSSPSLGSDLPLYSEVGWVHDGLGGNEPMVYMRQSPGWSCSGALWTEAMSWSRRSLGGRSAALF